LDPDPLGRDEPHPNVMDPQYWFTLQQIAWMNKSTEVTSDLNPDLEAEYRCGSRELNPDPQHR
jgi:hypothetical protein